MKHAKKFASLLLALVMALALTVPAFGADETYTITINDTTEGHTFTAYQIFAGDLSDSTLSNIVWGSGVNTAKEGFPFANTTAAAKAKSLTTTSDAEAFAEAIAPYLGTAAGNATVAKNATTCEISGLEAGYYLVKNTAVPAEDGVYTYYLMKIVKSITIAPKADVPKVTKKVQDTNDSTGETSGWKDSADYDIGDSVPFQLTATLADNVSVYDTYKVVFHDTLSKGLTYNGDAKVYIGSTETNGFTVTSTVNADGTTTLTVSCDDVKDQGAGNSSVITVEYTAKLNESATVGSAGNTNKVKLEYSNNPNNSGTGNNETGNTPEDTVVVFTYKTIINKVDGEKAALTGAAFKLEKKIKGEAGTEDTWTPVKEFTVDKANPLSSFEFSGLDDGIYKLTETVTPAGYNTIDPIEFTISAEHATESAAPTLTSLSGNATVGEIIFTPNTTAGSLTADVVNQAGTVLPETGGMGTTLFYILGSVLVLGAGVLLVVKKRMGADK